MQKLKTYKKQHEKDQQTIKYFDNEYRKSWQEFLIDKSEIECLCNLFNKHVDERRNESFL